MRTKELLLKLFNASLEAVSPTNLIQNHCKLEGTHFFINNKPYDLSSYGHIHILGSGKAALGMAEALEPLLNDYIHSGLVIAPKCSSKVGKIVCKASDHPIPSERSLQGAQALIREMRSYPRNDLYIYLLSGGSSSLIELPIKGVSLEDFQEATNLMLRNSLKIEEINVVRKHLSDIKGGRLGAYSNAEGIVIGISDVIGDDLYSIGSAPLYADTSTYKDAVTILNSYNIFGKMPLSVQKALNEGLKGIRPETPKHPSSKITHFLIGTNALARKSAYQSALAAGYEVYLHDTEIHSDVVTATQEMLDIAYNVKEKVIIFGGETTVKVEGNGNGGRNQHAVLTLLALAHKKGLKLAFISAGTDGIDGNSDAAGAMIDSDSFTRAEHAGLDIKHYLSTNDSYHFFKALNDLIMTGPTRTNVMDIGILIKE